MPSAFEEHHVPAVVHGRCLIRRSNTGAAAPLLVGFHGYAQTADESLDALLELPGLVHWHIAAIQALHPFYRSKLGDLGASWMTRLDRELAIDDNIRYIGKALEEIKAQIEVSDPVAMIGFSQGTAMAYRAAAKSGHAVSGVIALAGDVPAEILKGGLDGFPRVLIGRGTEDKWYDEGKMDRDLELLSAAGVEAETCVFEGAHEFTGEFNRAAVGFLTDL